MVIFNVRVRDIVINLRVRHQVLADFRVESIRFLALGSGKRSGWRLLNLKIFKTQLNRGVSLFYNR